MTGDAGRRAANAPARPALGNVEHLGLGERAELVRADVSRWLAAASGADSAVVDFDHTGAFDLVFVDAVKTEYGAYLTEALRLLRPGGVIAFDDVLWHDRVADPAQRDPETVAMRDLGKAVRDDERLVPVLLHAGDGLLAAVKR